MQAASPAFDCPAGLITCTHSRQPTSSASSTSSRILKAGISAKHFAIRVWGGGRAASTAIYFLLARGERSHWHRVDAAEIWHYYAGAPLVLEMADDEHGPIRRMKLGPDIAMGERPQGMVPAGHWQAAESLGEWTLGRLHGRAGI